MSRGGILDDAISILASTAAAQPFTDNADDEDDEGSGSGETSPIAAADRLLMQKMNSKCGSCCMHLAQQFLSIPLFIYRKIQAMTRLLVYPEANGHLKKMKH